MNRAAQQLGRLGGLKGGKARNPRKGFGSPAVLAKALATRRANAAKIGRHVRAARAGRG